MRIQMLWKPHPVVSASGYVTLALSLSILHQGWAVWDMEDMMVCHFHDWFIKENNSGLRYSPSLYGHLLGGEQAAMSWEQLRNLGEACAVQIRGFWPKNWDLPTNLKVESLEVNPSTPPVDCTQLQSQLRARLQHCDGYWASTIQLRCSWTPEPLKLCDIIHVVLSC